MTAHDRTDETRRESWTGYWKTGALHSLAGSFEGNYGGEIRGFWEGVFAPLTVTDRILDVGTGNGPLPALLTELKGEALPAVDAVDIASVGPEWHHGLPPALRDRIRFHGGCAVEDLACFDDGRFNLVASQYGLEYSNLPLALAELARLTSAGGRLALVLHHAGSRLSAIASVEASLIDSLLDADGLLARAAAIHPYVDRVRQGAGTTLATDPDAGRVRTRLNEAMQAIDEFQRQTPFAGIALEARAMVASRIHALMRGSISLEQANLNHESHAAALADSRFRSIELCSHALDAQDMARLCADLGRVGFRDARPALLHHGVHLVGWTLEARRD